MHTRTKAILLGLMAGLWMVAAGCAPPQQPPQLVPILSETFQSATSTRGGGTVTVRVKAEDPKGSALSFSWETQDGTLSTPVNSSHTSEVVWTAPPCARVESLPTLTATATNAEGLATSFDFTLKGVPLCTPVWKAVSAGPKHSLAADDQGRVWSWGANHMGQLGDGTRTERQTPIVVSGLRGVVAVAAGEQHSLAMKSDGSVWAWGNNGSGQLGDGTHTARTTPVQVEGLGGVVAIAANNLHSLAVKSDGTVWAWGYNELGQLGDGTTTHRATPVQVVGLGEVVTIAAGRYYSLAVKSDGTVWGWGASFLGHLGAPGRYLTPVHVHGLDQVVAVASDSSHSLAVKSDGTVWAWGSNLVGQLGDGTHTDRPTPVQVTGFSGGGLSPSGTASRWR